MTPEITDPRFKAIAEEIRKDPENASFTKRGIDPLFFAGPECRIMIVGQAPGRVAEESGIVWNDRSGDRLREWTGIDRDTFYNSGKLADLKLTILVGSYATKRYLQLKSSASLTQVVKDYRDYLPEFFPLVHPSPRNQIWMKKNPWFNETVIPDLQELVAQIMK